MQHLPGGSEGAALFEPAGSEAPPAAAPAAPLPAGMIDVAARVRSLL